MKNGIAEELASHLAHLGRSQGVPFFQGELWLLSQPALKEDLSQLALALRQKTLPDAQRLGSLVGAREVLKVDGGRLGRWSYQLKVLKTSKELPKLIEAGTAPLKRYHNVDIGALLGQIEDSLDVLKIAHKDRENSQLTLLDESGLDQSLKTLSRVFNNDHKVDAKVRQISEELDWIARFLVRVSLIFGIDTSRNILESIFSDDIPESADRLVTIPLHHPGISLPGLNQFDWSHVKSLNSILSEIPSARLAEIWPVLRQHTSLLTVWFGPRLLKSTLSARHLNFVAETPSLHQDSLGLRQDENTLEKYLSFLMQLDKDLLEKLDLESGWLRRLFESGSAPEQTLALTRSLRSQESGPLLAARLHALSNATGQGSPIKRALNRWETVGKHADLSLLEQLGNTPENEDLLNEYLHFRSLAGESECPSKNLLKILGQPDRLKARKRAKNLIRRSIEELKARSLNRVLDMATCELIEQITGQTLNTSELTEELRLALAVSQNAELDPTLFRDFLCASITKTPARDLPLNAAWMKASPLGERLELWAEGFRTDVAVLGERLTISTETSYLMAAQMGTMAQTCLSLENGEHAMSALINALDINKHVVYVTRTSGERIARKLIALSQSHRVIGYELYSTAPNLSKELKVAVDTAIRSFVTHCKLDLAAEGKPTQIHGPRRLWYDDGLTKWTPEEPEEDSLFPEKSLDAQVEEAFLSGREEADIELLNSVAWRQRRPWDALAAAELLKLDATRAMRWFDANGDYWSPPPHLTQIIWYHPGFSPKQRVELIEKTCTNTLRGLHFARQDCPIDRGIIQALGERHLRVFSKLVGESKAEDFCGFFYDIDLFVALPFKLLVSLISKSFEIRKDFNTRDIYWSLGSTSEGNILMRQARVLQHCWVLDPDTKSLMKALRSAKHFELVWVYAHILRELDPIPGAANVLKRHLEAYSRNPGDKEWLSALVEDALAAQTSQSTPPKERTPFQHLQVAVRGPKRLETLREFAKSELTPGTSLTLWLGAGDLASALTQEEATKLGRGVSEFASPLYYRRHQVEVMLLWCSEQGDMADTVEDLQILSGIWDEEHVEETGPQAIVDCLAHSHENLRRIASAYLNAALRDASALTKLKFAQMIHNNFQSQISLPIVHQILDAALDPSTGDDLEPHELWGASYAISQLCLAKIDA
ncbi:hypothetical protein FRD01_22725 [Microvenator marinus]|uniref:Uncharacterized protein n=1 Tax=Microvenator marinus TaxID=2600177 RepID=A0A5B8XWM7_9DELT|nr:hypothetical protein [Microvenator marinus]QED29995.1 hypothetical protein FRD01_22725 [Microvenator marinus]